MASIKDLKKRITSVKNTQQTTKAMKMVSAAKLRRAQEAITSQRPYAKRMRELISLVASLSEAANGAELIKRREGLEEAEKKKLVLVLVTSDRGLCGGFNSNVIKAAQRWIRENETNYDSVTLAFVGRKGHEFFKSRQAKMGRNFSELSGKVEFGKAKKLAEALLEMYVSGEGDEVKFIYNEFRNAASQKVVVEDFLPIAPAHSVEGAEQIDASMYLVKPNKEALLATLLEKTFPIQAFRIMLESQAGEHGARMSAMENATKNAGEMIRKLTLQYNKQRQASITKELLEIISGSESQKSSA